MRAGGVQSPGTKKRGRLAHSVLRWELSLGYLVPSDPGLEVDSAGIERDSAGLTWDPEPLLGQRLWTPRLSPLGGGESPREGRGHH